MKRPDLERILEENPDDDAQDCASYAINLEVALRIYANHDNWTLSILVDGTEDFGPEIAERALGSKQ